LIIIAIKYLVLVMEADNRGEGGILALMALVRAKGRRSRRAQQVLVTLGLFGAALLYGDAMITPAISVLSAAEGIHVAAPALQGYVVTITVAILCGLFFFRSMALRESGRFSDRSF
ncbi:MAG TPA: KUP/HAK/KT family potassium transporter, partial [Terriglobales bacterium]|nr:KUP/HAK/KT family potassium transporter [Terriglobales bacterium]